MHPQPRLSLFLRSGKVDNFGESVGGGAGVGLYSAISWHGLSLSATAYVSNLRPLTPFKAREAFPSRRKRRGDEWLGDELRACNENAFMRIVKVYCVQQGAQRNVNITARSMERVSEISGALCPENRLYDSCDP